MQVAILAGGLATRLRPLISERPKSMVEILGRPFLEYQIELLKENGIRDLVLCVAYLGEQIESYFGDGKRFGVDIRYSREGQHLMGTAGALKKAQSLLGDEFFVMYGDSYLFLDFGAIMAYFRRFDRLALMVVYKNYDRYDKSNVVMRGGFITEYSKEKKSKGMVYIDYGASLLRKEALEMIPDNQIFSLEELFSELIKRKELLAFEVRERFYEIGSPRGLEEFREYISRTGHHVFSTDRSGEQFQASQFPKC